MKKTALVFIQLVCSTCLAEQSCLMGWDGDVYHPRSITAQDMTDGLVLNQWVNYRAYNPNVPQQFEDKGANVNFKVLKFVPVETRAADCKDMPARTFDYDRVTTAAYLEATSEEPVFGSPVDGPNTKSVKAWALCKGLISKPCP